MKRVIAAIVAIVALVAISGCETVKGVGKDVKKAGEAIEKSVHIGHIGP